MIKEMTKVRENRKQQTQPQFKIVFMYAIAWISAIILPLIIWRLQLPIVQSTFDGSAANTLNSQPFELFGFFATILLAIQASLDIAKQPQRTWKTVLPRALPLLVCLNLLFIQVETFQTKSSDYLCYENAARAIVEGANPYNGQPPCYLYPPLLAQVLAFLHQLSVNNPLLPVSNSEDGWTAVTYFYQCSQFLQIILAYYSTYWLTQNLRLKALPASILVSALFLFNYPLIRTLTFDQVNLWLLNSFVLGILLLRRYPMMGGLAIAVGAHIKLYTLALLFPWIPTKRWKAVVGVLLSFAVINILQTSWASDWTLWQQFLEYFRSPEKPSNYRNNGIWSLVFNLAKIPSHALNTEALFQAVPLVIAGITLLVLIGFAVRFFQRERIYSRMVTTMNDRMDSSWLYTFRFYGHSIDAIAFSLLISPSVWEHHYVLAIPIAVLAIVAHQRSQSWLVVLGTFLIFCIPTFEIFPLSFHRLTGLLILVYLTTPSLVKDYFVSTAKQISSSPQAGLG